MNKKKTLDIINKQRIIIIAAILFVILSAASKSFFSYENIMNILMQMSIEGIVAIGMTLLMLQSEIDLSVGYNIALVGTIIMLLQKYNLPLAIVCGIIVGTLIGVINGLIVTRFNISSIPITLGMMIALNGVVLWLTNSQTIRGEIEKFLVLGNGIFYTIPYPVIIFIVLLITFFIIVGKTFYGRNLYAVGGNPVASKFFGINVKRIKLISFVISAFLTSIAGIILASRLNIASAIIGKNIPISVITAVLLGGTSIWGGEGGITKTFQGLLLLGIIANGLRMVQAPVTWSDTIKGLLLILVVSLDSYYVKTAKFR